MSDSEFDGDFDGYMCSDSGSLSGEESEVLTSHHSHHVQARRGF